MAILFATTGQLSSAQAIKPKAGAARNTVPKPPISRQSNPAANPPVTAAKAAEKPVSVIVHPNSEVSSAAFTLGEIAEITGDDRGLVQQLSSTEIGASPLPGLSRIINPGDVTVRLRQHHLDGSRVDLVLPPGIRITRLGRDIPADEVTRAAIESAKDAIKSEPNSTLEPLSGAAKLVVPTGKTQVVAGAWRGNPEIGTLTVPVSIIVDGKPIQVVDVALRIHRKTLALVALHDIQLHDIIGTRDVALAPVELGSGQSAPLTALEDGMGKRATRRIAAKSPIGAEMLEKAPLISANDSITIEFVYGALRVTATGVARQGGAEGDTIHVFAVDTRRGLDGVVVDRHTVRVDDAGSR